MGSSMYALQRLLHELPLQSLKLVSGHFTIDFT